jgi:hypothetical protein
VGGREGGRAGTIHVQRFPHKGTGIAKGGEGGKEVVEVVVDFLRRREGGRERGREGGREGGC